MAKKKSSGSNPLQRIALLVIGAIIVLVAGLFGINPDELQDFIDSVSEETTETTDSGTIPSETNPSIGGDWYDLYFTEPINTRDESRHTGATIEQGLIAAIDNAQSTIDGALFELNAPDTTAAFVRAAERGVRLRFVFDDEHAVDDPESTVFELDAVNVPYVDDGNTSDLMHNKFLIIDNTYVWTGSMNFTRNGMYNNNNNGILIRSSRLAQNYQTEFDEMFADDFYNRRGDPRQPPNEVFSLDGTQLETYFSPESGPEIEARLVELTNNAQSSVRVMVFSYTLDSIGSAMIDALNRGVTVEGVFEVVGSLQGQMRPLACAGANMRQDGNPNIQHHKVFIFDEAIVAMGSFNFSASARDSNNENLLIIHNPEIAAAYTAEWRERFEEGRIPSDEDLACG